MTKVQVSEGWLEGEVLDLVTGDGQYYSFKGIPYAAPPVGTLRFKAPRPPVPWSGVRPAKVHGAVCTQLDIATNQLISGSEDCLFLNVYTKNLTPTTPLPVMVFIHGGAYKSGSGDENFFGSDFLINKDVVLVTINYRLEALGFLCLETEDVPGNAGLKDQVEALKWVQKNIKNFGGNPNNVTIFGESAGGACTIYHVLSPMSRGLFHRAISMSGVPNCDWSIAHHARRRAFIVGKQLGIETDDPKELLEFLQSLPVQKLAALNPTVFTSEEITQNMIKMFHFTPVIEKDFGQEHFFTEYPFEILKYRKMNDVDLFMGHTSEEMLISSDILIDYFAKNHNRYPELLIPRELAIRITPDDTLEIADKIHKFYFGKRHIGKETVKEFARYLSEACFVYDIHRFAQRICLVAESKIFFYVFSCLSDRNVFGKKGEQLGIKGAAHTDDLYYLFDAKEKNMPLDKSSREYELIEQVTTIFTNFAKFRTPTPTKSLGITWPEYESSRKQYVDIGDKLTLAADYRPEMMELWRGVYEQAGIEF